MTDEAISKTLRVMPYGFYAITSCHNGDENAMVANWITQVSFEPQLVALALQKTSYTHGLLEQGGAFVVNIFKQEDVETLKRLTKGRAKNPDKMDQVSYSQAPGTGCPVLKEAAAYLECRLKDIIDIGGDHDIVVGEVIGAELKKPGEAKDMLALPDLGWSYAG